MMSWKRCWRKWSWRIFKRSNRRTFLGRRNKTTEIQSGSLVLRPRFEPGAFRDVRRKTERQGEFHTVRFASSVTLGPFGRFELRFNFGTVKPSDIW